MIDKNWLSFTLRSNTNYDNNDHWIYESINNKGYGRIKIDGKSYQVHRLSAYLFLGLDLTDITTQVNHTLECQIKSCWNPEHIYLGSHQENQEDRAKLITLCVRGHKLSGDNVRIEGKRRRCIECCRIRQAKYRRNSDA